MQSCFLDLLPSDIMTLKSFFDYFQKCKVLRIQETQKALEIPRVLRPTAAL